MEKVRSSKIRTLYQYFHQFRFRKWPVIAALVKFCKKKHPKGVKISSVLALTIMQKDQLYIHENLPYKSNLS